MTQLFVFVVQQISSIVQRTLCFNGRVDLLRFRVRADIFVDLPVLLCKGRTVSGEPSKNKQGRHTFQPHRETSPHQKSFRAAWASWDVVAPGRWKSIHCSDHRNSRNLPRTRSAKSSHSVNDTPFKREYFCHSHMSGAETQSLFIGYPRRCDGFHFQIFHCALPGRCEFSLELKTGKEGAISVTEWTEYPTRARRERWRGRCGPGTPSSSSMGVENYR